MSVSYIEKETFKLIVLHAETLMVNRRLDENSFEYLTHGERWVRLKILNDYVIQCCKVWDPVACVVELPYLGRIASAFGSLKEVVLTLRNAYTQWNPNKSPFFYNPSVIKKNAGVPGTSGDKNLMLEALKSNVEICTKNIDLNLLDEHAIDAILIAYAHFKIGIMRKPLHDEKTKTKRK
jgi:hypothetical protein